MLTARTAVASDTPTILAFLERKAEFDRDMGGFDGALSTSAEAIRDTLFSATPYAHALIAEDDTAVGFALFYFRYSSFRGRPSLWLDDLYVLANLRSRGIGAALMAALIATGRQHRCSHLAWTCAVRNERGQRFYDRLGARVVERGPVQLRYELVV